MTTYYLAEATHCDAPLLYKHCDKDYWYRLDEFNRGCWIPRCFTELPTHLTVLIKSECIGEIIDYAQAKGITFVVNLAIPLL